MFASKDLFLTRPSGYQISRSVRLRFSASAYFNRTPASAGNRKTFTWSGWVKIGQFGVASNPLFSAIISGTSSVTEIAFNASNQLDFFSQNTAGTVIGRRTTTQVFRDPSAWYHIVVAIDTSDATASNRIKLYVNGTQVTSFAASTDFVLNDNTGVNDTTVQRVGARASGTYFFDGYLTEINFIDGQALTPSSFGQTNPVTGVWQPIKYTGTYGTNGFYLNFSDNSNNTATTIGKDYSGNGNNWTPNNISVTAGATYDSMLDVPTLYADGGNGRGNYCVMNPLALQAVASLNGANLNVNLGAQAGTVPVAYGTIGVSTGKWYWEVTWVSGTANYTGTGITNFISQSGGRNSATYYYYIGNPNFRYNTGGGDTTAAYGNAWSAGDVIGVAFDADAGTLTFYKNGVSQGVATTGIALSTWYPAVIHETSAFTDVFNMNFGQRPFTYTPPTGFKALNTQNLPDATIKKGNQHFNVGLWTGTGAAQNITLNPFTPDLIWMKARNTGTTGHYLTDSVRGITKYLSSHDTTAEITVTDVVTSLNSDGFSLGTSSAVNTNGNTYAGWLWNAGGNTVSNTSGSITSSVRANPTAGVSVVTYTGTGANATVGHGLGVAPRMIIVKSRSLAGQNWHTYHAAIDATSPANFIVILNGTVAKTTSAASWNNTAPTSSVFSIGTDTSVNNSTSTYVAYCFAAVAGYSAFGSYTGNGSTDGPFIYTGFRPRFVMYKRTDTTGDWVIVDSARPGYNVIGGILFPNLANAEDTTGIVDITSNGFKLRTAGVIHNASGGTYIYAAFAENPFKLSLAR